MAEREKIYRCAVCLDGYGESDAGAAEKIRILAGRGEIELCAVAAADGVCGGEWGVPYTDKAALAAAEPEYVFYFAAPKKTKSRGEKRSELRKKLPPFAVRLARKAEKLVLSRQNRRKWKSYNGWGKPIPVPTETQASAFAPLAEYGIPSDRVIPARAAAIPGFHMESYIRLRQAGVSILSEDCWAGLMYNALGMEMRSPFINMFIRNRSYYKLIAEPEKYLCEELVPNRLRRNSTSADYYPIVCIGDVEMHFNHVHDPAELEEYAKRWYLRRSRVDPERLFIKYAAENETAKENVQKALASVATPRMILVPKPTDEPDTLYLEEMERFPRRYGGFKECARACAKNELLTEMPCDIIQTLLTGEIVRLPGTEET